MFKIYLLSLLLVAWNAEARPKTRILGGQDAPEGSFPFQISLRRTANDIEFHFCGGSIVRPTWILTAAHCIVSLEADAVTVVVGSNSIKEGGTRYPAAELIIHEDYNASALYNDVAVIRVASEISYNKKVQPIALPTENLPDGTLCFITGWGYINNYQRQPDRMQMLYVRTISVEKCQKDLERFSNTPVTEKHVCTYLDEGLGICQGDSGGPLQTNGTVVGLASWVIPCAEGYPDVFVRVYSYIDWILDKIDSE